MKTWQKMNKTKAILQHLQQFGSITSWEAIKEYGCTRLSAVIYRLRYDYNLDIQTESIDFIDRYGNKSDFAKYVLVKEKTNDYIDNNIDNN